MLVIAIASLLLLTVLSGLAFGSDVLMSFLKDPTPDVPGFLYYEEVNQSLLAAILRSSNNQITNGSPVFNPIYLGISIVLSLTTVIVTAANKHDSDDWMLLSILFLALIIYPAALEHYSVFLILPIVLLLQPSDLDIRGRLGILIVIFITYFLSTKSIFWADIFIWIVCIGLVANPRIQERINSRSKLESA